MGKVLKVSNGGSVLHNSVQFKPGDVVEGLTQAQENELIKAGYVFVDVLRDVSVEPLTDPDRLVEKAPGSVVSPPHRSDEPIKTGVTKAPVAPAPVMTGTWNFNPLQLAGKSLEQLNAMIIERNSTIKPFDTKEEAVAFLSQDFK